MKKQVGMRVDGAVFNQNGSDINWDEFIDGIELANFEYTGKSVPIDENGDEYIVEDGSDWTVGNKLKKGTGNLETTLLRDEIEKLEGLYQVLKSKHNHLKEQNEETIKNEERLRRNVKILNEQLDISHKLHHEEFMKVRYYEEVLSAILNIVAEQEQDELVDLIVNSLKGKELSEEQKEDSLEGKNLLAQFVND